uniref:Cadherin domain-containing protein n=1 Tax=Sinocyclocheilus grahami TaxID=75366 RepID=A0A672SNT1_SINGR
MFGGASSTRISSWLMQPLVLCVFVMTVARGQVRYSVPEEMTKGSLVGNIVQDLGLDVKRLKSGRARIFTEDSREYIGLNVDKGTLLVKERIDREELCAQVSPCSLHFQIILENPMELHRIDVEILDINDHAPVFMKKEIAFQISESALSGARYSIDSANDPDVGLNSIQTYKLTPSDHFTVKIPAHLDDTKYVEMILQKPLDRETGEEHKMILTAFDGGNPQKTGTIKINVIVLDANDNAPVFSHSIYKASIPENFPKGSSVLRVSATDKDVGSNGDVTYSFSQSSERLSILFQIDSSSGDIIVNGQLDFEKSKKYELYVEATDKGGLSDTSKVHIEITDINDNAPIISVISFSNPVAESSAPSTVIAMLNVKDLDSGKNGIVRCYIAQNLPFKIKSSSPNFYKHYTLVTDRRLDREVIDEYTVVVTATDSGSPPLSSQKTFAVRLSDVNDNAPVFSQNSYSVDVAENNAPGTPIATVLALDPDVGDNARLSYSILPTTIHGSPISSYVYINPDNGNIFTMRSLDYEQMNTFKIEVQVRDAGAPPQTSNITVHVFVVDQNDNPPVILYPTYSEDAGLQLTVPHGAPVGHRVNKLVAVDPDSGHNAWLFYSIAPGDDSSLFHIEPHTGELRTTQKLMDDEQGGKTHPAYNFIVVVRDNGQPALSTSVSVTVTIEEKSPDKSTDFRITPHKGTGVTDVTLYLIISLGCVTLVSLLTMTVLLVRCIRHKGGSTCCYSRTGFRSRPSYQQRAHKDLHLQLNTDGPIRYMEVVGGIYFFYLNYPKHLNGSVSRFPQKYQAALFSILIIIKNVS